MNYRMFLKGSVCALLFFFYSLHAKSQTFYSGEVHLLTQASTKETLPFWMFSNTRGRVSEQTNLLGRAAVKATHFFLDSSSFEVSAGGVFHDGFSKEFALDELYASYSHPWFYATIGIKQREQLYNGLSATNENILWSLNSRALPGIEIGTARPIPLFSGLAIELKWAEYLMEKERHVSNARVHHKSFHLVYRPAEAWTIRAGIQHFAQWGGSSPDRGKQPSAFTDYLRIFTGRQGGEKALQGDRENSLGNHLGSWELGVTRKGNDHSFSFIYNNLFEDGSGSRWANFPDGRYGLFFTQNEKNQLINSVMYEFFYTRHQSHDVNRWGADSYLNHALAYNSGWTYLGRVMGAPFFTYDPEKDRIINNKFSAHHLGIGGVILAHYQEYPYKLLFSYSHNEGTYRAPLHSNGQNKDIFSIYNSLRVYNGPILMDLLLAADFNNLGDPNFGAGVSFSYNFDTGS